MSTPTCTIVVHPPTFSTPASPVLAVTSLDSFSASRGSPSSLALFISGSPQSSSWPWSPAGISDDQYLLPPTKTRRRRKTRTSKPKLASRRDRDLPDPWETVTDPASGQLVLVPAEHSDDVAVDSRARTPAGALRSMLAGLRDPRSVPYLEWLFLFAHTLFFLF
ncbi:uncharacterized protein TRAVEDRAFT_48782 [Trametes versicolor FP-101664 SS1]|uniref:uncharacterized protein n=1 Tax=Trametes versicolor (strain FP-101664) TaxID=717944 RepID=UPI0004624452|nr:uncharacterized protein TRAVEDRAFT_48782 [Trametes versicolor FP-101664 SS1]EIW57752.1 hypothetical protein TRAVEDRAFT_48782 [Trametes versicolor FP-101664 SS1]